MSYLNSWDATNTILQAELQSQADLLDAAAQSLSKPNGITQEQYDAQWIAFNEAQRESNEHIAQLGEFYDNVSVDAGYIEAIQNGLVGDNNPYAFLSDAELNSVSENLSQDFNQLMGFMGENPYQYSNNTIDGVNYDSNPMGPWQTFNTDTPQGMLGEALINPEYRAELGKDAMVALFEALTKAQLARVLKDHPALNQALQDASFGDAIKEALFGNENPALNFPAWMNDLADWYNEAATTPDPILTLRRIGAWGRSTARFDVNGDGFEKQALSPNYLEIPFSKAA